MGILKLFTNPAGFATDFAKDKITQKIGNTIKDRGGFLNSIIDKKENVTSGFDKLQQGIQEKTGNISQKIDAYREQALGGGDVREALFNQLNKINERELPEVDEYKPAGKAAEWMNRLGAGLYAAGGGNPEDIYRNFRNKEMVKQERHQRQVELRQAALDKRDADVLNILGQIDTRVTGAATQFAGDEAAGAHGLQMKALDITTQMLQNEAADARHLMDLQHDFDMQLNEHQNRLMQMDKQGHMSEDQIRLGAEIAVRNQFNADVQTLGLSPASFETAAQAFATGNFDGLSQADSVRLAMVSKLKKARTDEEVMNIKLNTVANLVGTRVHARDAVTGEHLYDPRTMEPIYTSLANGEMAANYVFGGPQEAADAFGPSSVNSEASALETFLRNQSGQVTNPQVAQMRAVENIRGGYPTTQAASVNEMEADPRDAKKQAANAAAIWTKASGYLDQGADFGTLLQKLGDDGIHPEIMQMVVTQAVNAGYWDGETDKDRINGILMGLPQGRGD
jgi:hypothetical protein